MKKQIAFYLFAILLSSVRCFAQPEELQRLYCSAECERQSISINTGYNHSLPGEYNISERDEYWQVVQVPSGAGITEATPFCSYVIEPASVWSTDFPNPLLSQWISPRSIASSPFNNWSPNDCSGVATGSPFRLQRKFNICTPNDLAVVSIYLEMMADDLIDSVWVDGISIANFSCASNKFLYPNRDIVSVTLNLSPGFHTLSLDLRNVFGGVMGLNAQGVIAITDGVSSVTDPICYGRNSCSCVERANLDVRYLGVDVNGNCLYEATANVNSYNTVIGYEWSLVGINTPAVVHNNSSNSDTYIFSLAPGANATPQVTVHLAYSNLSVGQTPCCKRTLTWEEIHCVGSQPCLAIDGMMQATFLGSMANNDCDFQFKAFAFPPSGYTVHSYAWSVNGSHVITNTTGAVTDLFNYTVSNNTSATITVLITYNRPGGGQCTATITKIANCNNGSGWAARPASDVDSGQSTNSKK